MTAPRSVKLAPECFYAAVLDGAHLPRGRRGREEALSYAFEALLPEPLDAVHAIYRSLPDGRFLAIALSKETMRVKIGPDVMSLTPEILPGGLDLPIDAASLNLCTGEFTPGLVREARRRRWSEVAIAGALCAILLTVGFERRRLAALQSLHETHVAETHLLEAALGPATAALPPALRLQSELRTLRRTRSDASNLTGRASRDAALDFEALLRAWPRIEGLEVDSLVLTSTTWAIAGAVSTSADAERLASAISKHIKTEIPSVEAREVGAQFRLQGSFPPAKLP